MANLKQNYKYIKEALSDKKAYQMPDWRSKLADVKPNEHPSFDESELF